MKILIPILEQNGLDSKLSEHFGHCPFFGIYDFNTKKLQIIKNELDHLNSFFTPVDQIMEFKPDVVFSRAIGAKAIKLFNEKNVEILTGDYEILREVIENFSNLKKLTKGCEH